MLSGKLGEFYIIDIQKMISKQEKIIFKPFSSDIQLDIENSIYSVVPENFHEKSVYDIFKLNSQEQDNNLQLLSISTDRKLIFYEAELDLNENIQEGEHIDNNCYIDKFWSLNCLGGKANVLSISEIEPELIIMHCNGQKCLKTWDFSKKTDTLYINEFGQNQKLINQCSKMLMSKTKEGVAYVISDTKQNIQCYDMYQEQIYSQIEFSQKIQNIEIIAIQNQEQVQKILQNNLNIQDINNQQCQEITQESLTHSMTLIEQYSIQFKEEKQKITVLQTFSNEKVFVFGYAIGFQITTIIYDKQNQKQYIFNDNKTHNNNIRAMSFKISKKFQNILIMCCGGFDRKISTFILDLDNIGDVLFQFVCLLKHKFPPIKFNFSSEDKLLAVCYQHETIQIYDIFKILEQYMDYQQQKQNQQFYNNNQDKIQELGEFCNIRGHRGFINDSIFCPQNPDICVSISDDQTVKFWNINNITNKKIPNKPKKKNNYSQKQNLHKEEPKIQKKINQKQEQQNQDQIYISKNENITQKQSDIIEEGEI